MTTTSASAASRVPLGLLGAEALAERLAPLLVAAVGDDPLEPGQRGAHALDLALGLPAAADHAERLRIGARQVLRRDGARRAGAPLAEPVGLDDREQLGPVGGEEEDDEPRPFLVGDVALVAGDAELEIDGREHVEEALLDLQPKARLVLDGAAGDPGEALLDRSDSVLGGQELLDVGFTEEQRHRALV